MTRFKSHSRHVEHAFTQNCVSLVYFQCKIHPNFPDYVAGRRGGQNFLGTFDCHGTGVERMFGEILGPWRDSQDSIFWYIHGA